MRENITNNKMAVMPIKKLILNMGIPVIISMMMQAAYNIVESIFVAGMDRGEAALNALTLALYGLRLLSLKDCLHLLLVFL